MHESLRFNEVPEIPNSARALIHAMQENDYESSTTSSRGGILSKLRMKIDVLFKARPWNVEPSDLWNLGTLGPDFTST